MHGFSQIMNAYYLACKGTMPKDNINGYILKRLVANFILSFVPKQSKRRVGLLQGNLYALQNILSGNIKPELILNLK